MSQLKNFYEVSLQEKSAALQEVQKDVDRANAQVKAVARELAAERKSNAHVAAMRAEYERTVTSLHEAAESSRAKFERDLAAKETQVRAQAQLLADKDREFATLMDVKIKLDMEIKQYDKLLDHEESRLGFVDANHPSMMGVHGALAAAAARGNSPARAPTPSAAARAGRRESAGAPSAVILKSGRKGRGAAAAAAQAAASSSDMIDEEESSSSMSVDHAIMHTSSTSSSSSRRGGSGDVAAPAVDAFDCLSLSVSPSSRRFTLTNSARIDESDPSAGSVDISGLVLVASKSKQKLKLNSGVDSMLPPGHSVSIYTSSEAAQARPASAGGNGTQQVVVWEDCNEEEVWVEGEVVQIKDGKSKVVNSVQIRV